MNRRSLGVIAISSMLCAHGAWSADAEPTQKDRVAAARAVELAEQLRCLVCQNQTIADSNADLAVDLRRQVREQIAAGKTDAEIIDYMTARYGDFVLYRPPFKASTALLWAGPALLLLVGGIVAARIVRERGRDRETPLTDADRARAAELIAGVAPEDRG